MTHRPGDYAILYEAGLPVGELVISRDAPDQRADIEAHLRRQSKRPEIAYALTRATPPITADQFITALQDASQGNFMYLAYVLEDIAQGQADPSPLSLEALPRGLMGYYEQFWTGMEQVRGQDGWTEWRDLYRPAIALLASAGEPVTAEWLADLMDRDPDEISERALIPWQRFLSQSQNGNRIYWRIVHRSFADFLKNKTVGLAESNSKIAEWYLRDPGRWPEHGGYAHRHLAGHLAKAGAGPELGLLIERRDWYAAQRRYDPSRQAYARDVELAITSAEALGCDGIPLVTAWSLLFGMLASMATDVPLDALKALMLLGEEEQALRYAELVADPSQQATAFCEMAKILVGLGQGNEARARYMRALAAVARLSRIDDRIALVAAIAEVAEAAGDDVAHIIDLSGLSLVAALASTEPLEDGASGPGPDRRRSLLKFFAAGYQGDPLGHVGILGNDYERSEFLSLVAAQSVNDQATLQRVLAAAEALSEDFWRLAAWCEIARVGAAGREEYLLRRASAEADRLSDDQKRNQAWLLLADTWAQVAPGIEAHAAMERALSALEEIPESDIPYALATVAKAATALNDEDALSRVLAIRDRMSEYAREWDWDVTSAVSEGFAVMGQARRAMEVVQATARTWACAHAIAGVAAAFARRREVSAIRSLLLLAERIEEDSFDGYTARADAIRAVAKAFAEVNDRRGLAQARTAASALPRERDRASALAGVALSFVQVQAVDEAKAVLAELLLSEHLEADPNQAKAFSTLAARLAQAGNAGSSQAALARALDAARAVENDQGRDEALAAVVAALATVTNRELLHQCLAEASALVTAHTYCTKALIELVKVAGAMDGSDGLEQVCAVIEQVPSPYWKVGCWAAVASAYSELGDRDKTLAYMHTALLAISSIDRDVDKAAAITDLTQLGYRDGLGDALAMALRLPDPGIVDGTDWSYSRRGALTTLAWALAEVDDIAQAREAVEGIGQREYRGQAVAAIARALTRTGNTDDALEMLDLTTGAQDRDMSLAVVVTELAEHGYLPRATELCRLIKHPFYTLQGTSALFLAASRKGNETLAQSARETAFEALGVIHEANRAEALSILVPILGEVGDRDGLTRALKEAEYVKYPWDRADVLSSIATALAQAGDVELAYATIERGLEILDTDDSAGRSFSKAATALGSISSSAQPRVARCIATSLQVARTRGQNEVLGRIGVIVDNGLVPPPHLEGLWQHIQAVEAIFNAA